MKVCKKIMIGKVYLERKESNKQKMTKETLRKQFSIDKKILFDCYLTENKKIIERRKYIWKWKQNIIIKV